MQLVRLIILAEYAWVQTSVANVHVYIDCSCAMYSRSFTEAVDDAPPSSFKTQDSFVLSQ